MSKFIDDAEYQALKNFILCYDGLYTFRDSPPAALEAFRESYKNKEKRYSLKTLKSVNKDFINGIIEETHDWSPRQIAEADARLAAAGVLTLSEVQRRYMKGYDKKYQAILKRGVIRNVNEAYIIKNARDAGIVEPDSPEGIKLQQLFQDYEKMEHRPRR